MIRVVGASLVLLVACAHHRLDEDAGPPDARVDARPDAGPDDAGPPDTGAPDVFVPPPEPTCVGQPGPLGGPGVRGTVPIGEFAFPFVTAGIDEGWCHTLYFRAGDNELFSGDVLEVTVNLPSPSEPGEHIGTLNVSIDGEFWAEDVQVVIERADGLFESSLPMDERAATLRISHHDATSDIEIAVSDVAYTCNFPICL